VIGQRGIDEWFLPVECFRGAATGLAIIVEFLLYSLWKEFRNRAQPQSLPSIPSIQRFPKNKLPAVGVVAKVKPIINFAPLFGAFSNRCSRFPRIDAPDHNIHAVQPSFGVEPFRDSLPVEAPEQIQPVSEDYRFVETNFRLTEGLPYAIRGRDDVRIKQSDVKAFRMSVCQKRLMQVGQPCSDGTTIAAASNYQYPHSVLQQFGMNLVHFHSFIPHFSS
jgi:hypothetical protein